MVSLSVHGFVFSGFFFLFKARDFFDRPDAVKRLSPLVVSISSLAKAPVAMSKSFKPSEPLPQKLRKQKHSKVFGSDSRVESSPRLPDQAHNPSFTSSEDLAKLRAQIEENLVYPFSLRRKGIEGVVKIKLILNRFGHLKNLSVVEGSGHPELDQLALSAVKNAAPFPPSENSEFIQPIILPIEFKLHSTS